MKYITAPNILHNKNDISINIFSEKGIINSHMLQYMAWCMDLPGCEKWYKVCLGA